MDSYEGEGSDPSSLHKYMYCRNNPLNRIDPRGNLDLAEISIAAGIGSLLSIGDLYFSSHGTATWDQYLESGIYGAGMGVVGFGGVSFMAMFGTGGAIAALGFSASFGLAAIDEAAQEGNPALVLYRTFTLGLFAAPSAKMLTRTYTEYYNPSRSCGLFRLRQMRSIINAKETLAGNRNVAYAELEWGGTEDLCAVSGSKSPEGTVPSPRDGERAFTYSMSDGLCSEAKIYEYVAKKLEGYTFARLTIWSEKIPCDSCIAMKKQFETKFPKVNVDVYGMEQEVK